MNAPTTPGAPAPTETANTPKPDHKTREAIDEVSLQLAQAYAVARLMEDEEIRDGVTNHAAGAIATLIDSAMAKLAELEGAAA